MTDVPVFYVINGRCFASPDDKAALDRYLAATNAPPLPVDLIWATPSTSYHGDTGRDCSAASLLWPRARKRRPM